MRVLILANNDIGLYKFRKELIEELLNQKNEVYISLPDGNLVKPFEQMGCTFIDTPVDRRGMNPKKDFSIFQHYRKIMKAVSPDLVITYTIKPNIYGGIAARLAKKQYVVNITGLGTAFENDGLLKKLVTIMHRFALKKAKVVLFENSANRDLFVKERIIEEEKTCVLHGAGVNLEHFSYQPYPANDVFRFLFIGRVMREKGIDELFEAMRKLVDEGKNCYLDVVGPLEEDYETEIIRCEREGWMKYHGYQVDVRPYIRECDCFVLPSYHEGMANTNLECAAMGRPVITSNISGCREAVVDGVSGYLCEPKNVESLYSCMKKMLEEENREEIGRAGRKHMEDVFDKRRVVEATIEAIGDIS